MKLKETISLPGEEPGQEFTLAERLALANLTIASNSPDLHEDVYERVLVKYLQVPTRGLPGAFGPAEYFTQKSDRMVKDLGNKDIGVFVALTGVSKTDSRSNKMLWEAVKALNDIYSSVVRLNLGQGMKAQVYTNFQIDHEIPYLDRSKDPTPLLETDPFWYTKTEGTQELKQPSLQEVVEKELEAHFGYRMLVDDLKTLLSSLRGE